MRIHAIEATPLGEVDHPFRGVSDGMGSHFLSRTKHTGHSETVCPSPISKGPTVIINTDHIKTPVHLVVGFSVGSVAKRIIQNNAVPETKFQSIQVFVAATVLAGMAVTAAGKYTDEKIDSFFEKHFGNEDPQPIPADQTKE